jgi:hypothetical protein
VYELALDEGGCTAVAIVILLVKFYHRRCNCISAFYHVDQFCFDFLFRPRFSLCLSLCAQRHAFTPLSTAISNSLLLLNFVHDFTLEVMDPNLSVGIAFEAVLGPSFKTHRALALNRKQ